VPTNSNLLSYRNQEHATITMSDAWSIIHIVDPNLQLNSVQLGYGVEGATYWTGSIGVDNNASLTNLWSNEQDHYNLYVKPVAGGVYAGQSPIAITLELFRPQLSNAGNWPTSRAYSYIVAPTNTQVETSFYEENNNKSWWTNSFGWIGGASHYDNWSFYLNSGAAYLGFSGTPYYASVTNAGLVAGYNWTYSSTQQVSLSTTMDNIQSVSDIQFNAPPSGIGDVMTWLHNINTGFDALYWGQINAVINNTTATNGTIVLSPVAGSINYTQGTSKTINWTSLT
jgi:hypothetical protein